MVETESTKTVVEKPNFKPESVSYYFQNPSTNRGHGWEFHCGDLNSNEQIHVNYNYFPPEYMIWKQQYDGTYAWEGISSGAATQQCANW